jgi:hypothetical protein
MASNRSRASDRSAALAATAEARSQALKALARRAARIQKAACSPAAMTLTARAAAGWIAQKLDELTALPRAAADHFDTRVARVSTDN